ncbi:MAG: hypothetical protein HC852_04250 [Acaryochloridaceae cyanobacterium RU_4_10]|nr:hypothetical protein [Acaryochloridaceae cyanobacterium RU_4_10]
MLPQNSLHIERRQTHAFETSRAQAIQHDQAGRQSFDSGDFATAAQRWRQAAQAYEHQQDWAAQAQTLSNLALAYQRSHQPSPAARAIAQSLALLGRLEQRPEQTIAATTHLRARILTTQGSLQLGQDPAAALKTWIAAETAYKAPPTIQGNCSANSIKPKLYSNSVFIHVRSNN